MSYIGLFGITGNPPHFGHMNALSQVVSWFDEIWVSPVLSHPFNKSGIISYEHRFNMLENLIAEYSPSEKIKIKELDRMYSDDTGISPVYTYALLKWLEIEYPENKFAVIMGEDNEKYLEKFYMSDKLIEEYKIYFVKENIGMHSTKIRSLITDGVEVSGNIGSLNAKYIKDNGLYNLIKENK